MAHSAEEFFVDTAGLEHYGENIGSGMKSAGSVSGRREAKRLLSQLSSLSRLRDALARLPERERENGASQWLLDNFYLAKREALSAAEALQDAGRIRAVTESRTGNGTALILSLAEALTDCGGGTVTAERCALFLTGFQKRQALTLQEIHLFVPALRAVLVKRIERLARENAPEAGEKMGRAFTSLRLLGTLSLSEMLARVDRTEQILRRDPAGVYPQMDTETRQIYRRRVAQLARKHGCMEHRLAERVLQLSENAEGEKRHVGWYLFREPLGQKETRWGGGLFIALQMLLPLFFALLTGFLTGRPALAALTLFPIWEFIRGLSDRILLRALPGTQIPRMELKDGIPPEGKTLCALSVLLTGGEQAAALADKLERFRLANRDAGENLLFLLLADLPESAEPELPEAQAWLSAAGERLQKLNETYGGGFFLLYRERQFCETDGKYRGWERKRGALLELARFLHGENTSLRFAVGDGEGLSGCRYILALDADTELCPGTAKKLAGAMLHPLNRPTVDEKRRIVVSGHGVLAPRISTALPDAGKTRFSRLFAGQGGTDPYGACCGEITMDLFGQGGFAGKGILDVDAFLTCMEGRIPENRVLSHDILEGAFLRCGYMSDVELTDGFPAKPVSFLRRLERWTRGDWQNIPWIFCRGRDLPDGERWRIFDNLRRSLTLPTSLTCLLLVLLLPGRIWRVTACIGLAAIASELLFSLPGAAKMPRQRFHSRIYPGLRGSLLRTLVRLLLLPTEALTLRWAIYTALWRMTVSRKNLLQWQTAAQSEAGTGSSLISACRVFWPCLLLGAVCIVFSPLVIGKTLGLLWLFAPGLAWSLGKESAASAAVSETERAYLLDCAREMWVFFRDFCTEEEHFLPPDNFQQSPPVGVAHRTSPTNIGLCLLCALAADDLHLAPAEECFTLIGRVLDTVETLPKWHGHIYNWTDTRTLETLHPGYISTVDSGNLAACLVTLTQGLREKGQSALAQRAETLWRNMDFRPLYDEKRHLFHIGWDVGSGRLTEGWYDLLSSEARLTGFVAIAKGDVPRAHWRHLSRALLEQDGYRGMASWTGTTFEYLMPELLLPLYRDSLLYETACFCAQCQKKRTATLGLPWGCSESAFSALDGLMNYRYKAHGVSALALRRGMDTETVIAPYASFLTLEIPGNGAVDNLRRLEQYGARGSYGFWDAVDFTPQRLAAGETHSVVRCVMAHHVGMSLLAVCNCLENGMMQRRFMQQKEMFAFSGLLQERVPVGGGILRRDRAQLTRREKQKAPPAWERDGEALHFPYPECCVLSNGFYNIMSTETGAVETVCRELIPYRGADDFSFSEHGIELLLHTGQGETSLLPVPDGGGKTKYAWKFRPDRAVFSVETPLFTAETETAVAASEPGERREIRLVGKCERPMQAEILLRLEVVLAREEDYVNHPAYYGLGLCACSTENGVTVRRLPRGKLEACALALCCDREMHAYALRDRSRYREIGAGSALVSGQMELRVPVTVFPQQETVIRFALCVAKTERGAADAAQRVLQSAERAVLPGVCVGLLGLQQGLSGAYALLRRVRSLAPAPETPSFPREALWSLGISGDLPIVFLRLAEPESLESAAELLRQHGLLSACGQHFDVVLLDPESGYQRPKRQSLLAVLRSMSREDWLDAKGGVHFIADTQENLALLSGAGVEADADVPALFITENIMSTSSGGGMRSGNCPFFYGSDGTFCFDASDGLPPRVWSNILTNGAFGCIASEYGTGAMWLQNAREAQLTAWRGKVCASDGTEQLEMIMSTENHSLFAYPGDGESRVEYGFGTVVWRRSFGKVRVRTTAFVPPETRCRVLLIETEGAEGGSILWKLTPLLAADAADRTALRCRREGEVLCAENPRFLYPEARLCVAASEKFESTCDRDGLLSGRWDDAPGAGRNACLALRIPAGQKTVIVCGTECPETLRLLARPDAAEALLKQTQAYWRRICGSLTLHSPDGLLDDYVNGWALYQTYACRMLGRCSLYQNGGAFGFRDQLQDAVNLLPMLIQPASDQILAASRHQYPEGDVMHWWHCTPAGDRGVRTRCSDDLLWLPWALCEYTEATGDTTLARQETAYVCSAALTAQEESRYECPAESAEKSAVLEHCFRALELVIARGTGAHGLPLILGGDWNDGFDRVGAEGKGESVWLGWFFAHVAERFAALAESLDADSARTERIRRAGEALGRAANEAWDGEWFLRGWFDDGTPMGTKNAAACRIDSIAQSFSVLCKQASPERVSDALRSAERELFTPEDRLVRLFAPPFAEEKPVPGYITSYGAGFRENGGQYTHGALWLAMALLQRGETDRGYAILRALLPGGRDTESYGAEPFVLAADVYSAPGHEGRAGWSWYTGSAGWMLRIVLRELLGVKPEKGGLRVSPRLPAGWTGYTLRCRDACGNSHDVEVTQSGCCVDGQPAKPEVLRAAPEN